MERETSIFRSLALIESQIAEKLTVEHIAKAAYISKYHYQRLFREIVGDSVMDYVAKRRLILASRALLETDASIIDIALAYGYGSREGFTRRFKAFMGVSPSAYRKNGLDAISQEAEKEKTMMNYSPITEETVNELNEWIERTKSLSDAMRRTELPWYKEFWVSVADDTDAIADRLEATLSRVNAIAEDTDEISHRFAILKAMEDIAIETNIMALHIALTAVGRAKPEDIKINKPLSDRYAELAQISSLKAEKVAGFLSELAMLILDAMRKEAEEKIGEAIQKGRAASAQIQGYAIYIKEELTALVDALEQTPIDRISVARLEDCLRRMKTLSLAAKTDGLRLPTSKPIFLGIGEFITSLEEAIEFCQMIIQPEHNLLMEKNIGRPISDIIYHCNLLRFYTKGEVEKMGGLRESGGLLTEEQKSAFSTIDNKINNFIQRIQNETEVLADEDMVDRISEVAAALRSEAEKLATHGGAIHMLADQFQRLGEAVAKYEDSHTILD